MSVKIIDGRKIAKDIKNKVASNVKTLKKKYNSDINITTVKIGDDPSSDLYLRLRDKACDSVGINSKHKFFPLDVSEDKVLDTISSLNNDSDVHGILVQFPLPGHIHQEKVINYLESKKDVEGFHPVNMGRTLIDDEYIVPCTPLAVISIMEYEKTIFEGLDVCIINHSNVVGKPLSAMFLNRNSTVSVCHVFSKDTKFYSKHADVLVTATGIPNFLTRDFVKSGAFVIDVGISQTNIGVCGDVDFESVKDIAGRLTPVPGGVGPVTIACSLINMLKTFSKCFEEKKG